MQRFSAFQTICVVFHVFVPIHTQRTTQQHTAQPPHNTNASNPMIIRCHGSNQINRKPKHQNHRIPLHKLFTLWFPECQTKEQIRHHIKQVPVAKLPAAKRFMTADNQQMRHRQKRKHNQQCKISLSLFHQRIYPNTNHGNKNRRNQPKRHSIR